MLTLRQWARQAAVRYETARQWFHSGLLPVPARQLPSGTIVIDQKRAAPLSSYRGDMDQSADRRAFLRVAHERLVDPHGATEKERWATRQAYLIQRRNDLGLSQSDLDARIGWADGLTAKYEAATRCPRFETVELWLQGLDIRIELVPGALTSNSDPDDTTRAHTPR